MNLRALIIDDEPFVRDDLRGMLAAHKEIEIFGEAGTIAGAQKLLKTVSVDVVFLDIQLRGGSGFDLVPFIDPAVDIIFVTAHNEFAVRAFEVNALDYLLKPVTAQRLAESLRRVMHKGAEQPADTGSQPYFKPTDSVFVKTDSGQLFVKLDQIAAVSTIGGNYAALFLDNREKLVVRKTLKKWAAILPPSLFTRIHRSTIVNIDFIERIAYEKDGSGQVHLAGQTETFAASRRLLPGLKNILRDNSP
jgi:two-component system LytT family response regulator